MSFIYTDPKTGKIVVEGPPKSTGQQSSSIPYWQNPNYTGGLGAPPPGKVWNSAKGTWDDPVNIPNPFGTSTNPTDPGYVPPSQSGATPNPLTSIPNVTGGTPQVTAPTYPSNVVAPISSSQAGTTFYPGTNVPITTIGDVKYVAPISVKSEQVGSVQNQSPTITPQVSTTQQIQYYPGTHVPMGAAGSAASGFYPTSGYTTITTPTSGTNAGVSTGSISNLPTAPPDLAAVTELVNLLNRNAQQQANQNRIPGASGLEQQSSSNIASLLAGNVPSDVQRNLYQTAAERGIAVGSPGSDNSQSALLRALGLTSLGLQSQGQSDLSAAYARNPAAPIFDPTTQLLTPAQKLAAEQNANQLGLEWWKALYGNRAGTGVARPTSGGGGSQTPAAPNMDWFTQAMRAATGGTPSPQYPGPINYTGTGALSSTPVGPTNLNDYWNAGYDPFSGVYDPSLGVSPPTSSFGPTNLNDYWNAGYDPFSGYYDPGMAVDNTDYSSSAYDNTNYDPTLMGW